MKLIPSDTVVRWGTHPAEQGRLLQLDGKWDGETVPKVGEVIMRPFLVDPVSKLPVPVRVVQVQERFQQSPPTLSLLVTRDH